MNYIEFNKSMNGMNLMNLMNVPSEERLFCFVNYHVFNKMKDKNGCIPYPGPELLKAPITAPNLEIARIKLANIFKVPVDAMSQWEKIGEEDGFTPSLRISFDTDSKSVGYCFDVYITVNTLALLEN